jgi:hypothetical protein
MPSSLNDFRASFVKDLAKPNRFDVNIPVPLTLFPYRNTGRTNKRSSWGNSQSVFLG